MQRRRQRPLGDLQPARRRLRRRDRRDLARARAPGRLEWLGPDLLVDCAHNVDGAIRLAEKHGVSLPTASVARETLRAVKSQGNGHIDSSAVVIVLEAMADTSVVNQ